MALPELLRTPDVDQLGKMLAQTNALDHNNEFGSHVDVGLPAAPPDEGRDDVAPAAPVRVAEP